MVFGTSEVAPVHADELNVEFVDIDDINDEGLLFDEDALVVDYQLDSVDTTPIEARKHFYNTWYSFARNIISDPTEKAILYYMAD